MKHNDVKWYVFLAVAGIICAVVFFSSRAYGAPWRSVGPGGGGWLVDVEYSPVRNELFTALDCGGVRVSRNNGMSWEIPSAGLGSYYGSEVEDVAVHPKNPKLVFFGCVDWDLSFKGWR